MIGTFNNETGLYEECDWIMDGLWLEQKDTARLFIITDESNGKGSSENEGPDHAKILDGPNEGRFVLDVLNEICQKHNSEVNPNDWEDPSYWENLGFVVIPHHLKRFNEEDGYYHA